MELLDQITKPIEADLAYFTQLFNESLSHDDNLLGNVLNHIKKRGGKRMRPILMMLIAKNYGQVSEVTQNSALGLELLHTASLVHDDVVDESEERRGQASVNASYNNKVAVLVGDFILSTALLHVSYSNDQRIVQALSNLGRTLASGEILQLQNIRNAEISEEVYFQVIRQKTAVLFAACAAIGALSAGADDVEVEKARQFGSDLGVMFQIRDDIFDYSDSKEIGKPTGNDMAEGKLTLPVIYALKKTPFDSMLNLAKKVKAGTINSDEIAVLVEYTKKQGGIEYAEKVMEEYHQKALSYIKTSITQPQLVSALEAYLDYVIKRTK